MAKRSLDDIFNNDPLGLLNVEIKHKSQTLMDTYLFNGFNDIQAFFERTGRIPQLNESEVIEELRLAKRLNTFRNDINLYDKLEPFDKYKLLDIGRHDGIANKILPTCLDDILDNELLAMGGDDIFYMKHITEKKQSVNEYTAQRKPCNDFEHFRSMFEQVQSDLDNKRIETGLIEKIAKIQSSQWFIVQGMLAYVAETGEKYEHRKGHHNARLRVIFSNKTESDLLLRSFGAALYKDPSARRVYVANEYQLLDDNGDEGIAPVGTVYVLKTLSQQSGIKEHREYLHKIGVTIGSVKSRIANAEKDPTFLLAPVEIVGEFKLYHMNVKATEKLLQKFFHAAQADVEIKDRFGNLVRPREWFFVTVGAIQDAVKALQENKILNVRYDSKSGKIVDK